MLDDETKIGLNEARELLPGRPAFETVWRWAIHGFHGDRLEYVRCGRKIFTSAEAVARFLAAMREHDQQRFARSPHRTIPTIPATRTERRRQRDQAAARTKLETAGI